MSKDTLPGCVTRLQSGFYTVQTAQGTVTCGIRGRLKQRKDNVDFLAIGDRVQILVLTDGSGVIEVVEPRKLALVRLDPRPRSVYQQVILANPDQMALVFACTHPAPHLRMLDRFLVICEKQNIPPLIIANKIDLVGLERAQEIFSMYPPLGYKVLFTSAKAGNGLEDLRENLTGRVTGLAGPSGVGKSSLLNAVQPELGLAVREINTSTDRGRHTTVVREMFSLNSGGYVVDLPGLRTLALWDTEPEELDGYFPELRTLVRYCQFNDCKHLNEPGCAVIEAVEEGRVHPERYESYLRLRFGEELQSEEG